jgi:hypothetical protein
MIQAEDGNLWNSTGCWQDGLETNGSTSPDSRILDAVSISWQNMTNEICADTCAKYQYFGTQFCRPQPPSQPLENTPMLDKNQC